MADELRLDGRVAIVTGAGGGIGRAHAMLLAQRGATVVVNDLGCTRRGDGSSPDPADSVVAEIRAAGGTAIADYSDVSRAAGADSLIDQAKLEFGRVDIVLNNAGLSPLPWHSFTESTLEGFQRQLNAHFVGTYNVTRSAWPLMVAAGYGRVVMTLSTSGFYGLARSPEYAVAKAAVQGLLYSLALEAEDLGIKVNGIGPGGYTRMVRDAVPNPDAPAPDAARVLLPELCSPLALLLAHEDCPVNGVVYEAHAGRVARVYTGETQGYWNFAPTPEDVRDNLAEADDTSGLFFPEDGMALAGWTMDEALKRGA